MLDELLISSKRKYSNKLAIKTIDQSLTYKELIDKSCAIAEILKEFATELNIVHGAPCCGLMFNQGVDGIVAVISCVLAGLTYVPLDILYPKNRLVYMSDTANIKLLITNTDGIELTKELANTMEVKPKIIVLDELEHKTVKEYTLPREASKNKNVYLLYTSGSTGKPKAIVQKEESVIHFASQYINNLTIKKEDNLTLFSTYGHDAAIIDIFSSLLSGACLYPLDLRNPNNLITIFNWLKKNEITVWHSVPSVFRMVWNSCKKIVQLPKLRLVVLGGEAVRENDLVLCNEKLNGVKLYNLYGQTESSYSAGNYITEKDDITCIGLPVKDTNLFIDFKDGDLKNLNDICLKQCDYPKLGKHTIKEGELIIKSNFIANNYWKNEESTQESFINSCDFGNLYRTGDYVSLLENGKVVFSGRKDNQIKIRGNRVEIGEIESTILRIKDILECIVMDETVMQQIKLVAFIKSNKVYSADDINSVLKEYLPIYMMIFRVVMIDTFPITATGKIDRNKLISYISKCVN